MNGWLVKIKDIDKIKKAIQVDRATALEKLYVYGWAIRAEMNSGLNYKEAVEQLRYVCEDIFIEEVNDFAIMKAGAKYLVLDMSMLCETEELGIKSDDYYQLYDLLEGNFNYNLSKTPLTNKSINATINPENTNEPEN